MLVTGADGFVGRHLVRRLLARTVTRSEPPSGAARLRSRNGAARQVTPVPFELTDGGSIESALQFGPDAVVHLAAVASNREAWSDPGQAWVVNAAGTARLAEALARRKANAGSEDAVLLVVSSGEVYGAGEPVPRVETDPLRPQSPYAASKVGGEVAALEVWRRDGPARDRRPAVHPHRAGPADSLRAARVRRSGCARHAREGTARCRPAIWSRCATCSTCAMSSRRTSPCCVKGRPGEVYNISRGEGQSVREIFHRLAELVGVEAEPRPDPELTRARDLPYLVGNSSKLRAATGWAPAISLDAMLRGLLDAQAD